MKAYIRIVGTFLPTLINIRALVCVISEDFVRKLRLKIEANDRIKVALLERESKIKIIGLIPNMLIAIQKLYTLGLLYVIRETESVIILETD